jgi:hypothetical protein
MPFEPNTSRLRYPVASAFSDSRHGQAFNAAKPITGIWAEITDVDPDEDRPNYFQWKEVTLDRKPNRNASTFSREAGWQEVDHGNSSFLTDGVLFDPAIEMNAHEVPIGSIVRLLPGEPIVDEQNRSHRLWLFSFHKLRPFSLTQDLFPTAAPQNPDTAINVLDTKAGSRPWLAKGTENHDRDTTVNGRWLDLEERPEQSFEDAAVTLYANHRSGWPFGDQFISLGLARGETPFTYGTKGWATYKPHGTLLDYDEAGDPVWRGEWQIASLDAELIAPGHLIETIQPGVIGKWRVMTTISDGTGNFGPQLFFDSLFDLEVYNTLPVPLTIGALHNFHFDRSQYMWFPVTPLATAHGLTLHASGTVDARDNNVWKTVPLDSEVGHYGVELIAQPFGIVNAGEMTQVGHASWSVTAERLFIGDPDDIDSVLEVALFNGGAMVTGTASRISSSRRTPPNLATSAVNGVSGSVIQFLSPRAKLELMVRKRLGVEDGDAWRTLGAMCHLTYETISSSGLRP